MKRFLVTAEVRLCLVLWTFGFILVLLAMAAQGRVTSGWVALSVLPMLLLGVALSLACAKAIGRADRKSRTAAAAVMLAAVIVSGVVMTTVDHFLNMLLALTLIPSWRSWALTVTASQAVSITILYTWTLLLSLAVIWAARTNDAARFIQARAAAFEAAAARAETANLRLQLNPHLIFNTLNGIASLVVRGKDREAEEMIGRLADFMRISFASDPAALVTLDKELDTARAYLNIEEVRFGERLKVSYDLDPAARAVLVPNFLLQPLVENAIKHGLARSRGEARIRIEASCEGDRLKLQVVNSGVTDPASPAASTDGLGLVNVRQRLESIYGPTARLTAEPLEDGFIASISLPRTPPRALDLAYA